jgi:hypothetical protein
MPEAVQPPVTEEEYWTMFHCVRGDVEVAIKTNYAYLKIHNLAARDRAIFDRYQRDAHFWTLSTLSLQTTFFIAFGRIFDHRRDSFSIHKVVDATIANPAFFSKDALLRRRRRLNNGGLDPDWLDFVNQAWEPTTADLEPLRTALIPHYERFKVIYQPIRHKYFAHRGTDNQQAISELFSQTRISDVSEILGFLHTLIWSIQELANSARVPDLNDRRDYADWVRKLDERIETFVLRVQ